MNLVKYFYALVQQIPAGRVSTYGALARALGDMRSARAVGRMLNLNPTPIVVPCHRVVMGDGTLGGFGLGIEKKIEFLESEGIRIKNGRVMDFKHLFFDDFKTTYPLRHLRKEQEELAAKVRLEDDFSGTRIIAGVDVAYDGYNAYAAAVLVDRESIEEPKVFTATAETSFPYIPTYLTYREIPAIEKLLDQIQNRFDVLLLDGNGSLHPRGIGIASHIGVLYDIPTIGVAKNLLCGNVVGYGQIQEVIVDGVRRGFALWPSDRVKTPIFVSPGHRISCATSLKIVRSLCKYKIPEPLRRAHLAATELKHRLSAPSAPQSAAL